MTELSIERVGKVTASRLPGVLGLSPHTDRVGVMREMVREYFGAPTEFAGNIVTDYGHEHEPDAITEYERARGVLVMGMQQFFASPLHPIGATVDGLVGADGVVEAKAPYRALYLHVDERPDIEVQIRLQMECTRRQWGDLCVWRPSGISISRVEYDADWFPSVLPAIEEFYAEYQATLEDAASSEPYLTPMVDERTDAEWQLAAFDWNEAKAERDRAQQSLDAATEVLRKLSDGKKSKGSGVQVIPSNRSGKVDWVTAAKDYGIDADKYREAGTTILTVRKAAQ